MNTAPILIVGGGLAGAEAAWQLAQRGFSVELREMRPVNRGPAHETDFLAELVCSNSLRGGNLTNAVGLLKEEMRRLGSIILEAAEANAIPAGSALAVDRVAFASTVTKRLEEHELITVSRQEVSVVPDQGPVIIATGPLTSEALAESLRELTGDQGMAYYDAIAPVVDTESLDHSVVFAAGRYGEGADYLNVPLDQKQYFEFVRALNESEKVEARPFEKPKYFEGCLPVEVMASRGPLTLAHGPLKPIGLIDPRTGDQPFAVIQLRREDAAGTAYNLVGFQTRMTQKEQLRVLRSLPGLENVRLLRYGAIHRNTFVSAPEVLDEKLRLRARSDVRLAGQITGVEGYVESAACGLLAGLFVAEESMGVELPAPPEETALGGLLWHLKGGIGRGGRFQPSNVTWALLPPAPKRRRRAERRLAAAERALTALESWMEAWPEALKREPQPR